MSFISHFNILQIFFNIVESALLIYSSSKSLNSSNESNSLTLSASYFLIYRASSLRCFAYKSSHKPFFVSGFSYSVLKIAVNLSLNSLSKYTCPNMYHALLPPTVTSVILPWLSHFRQYSSVSPAAYTAE